MLLRHFYDSALAQASWLVGCQRTGEALVIDPARDVKPYFAAAQSLGLRITAATETHIHADFVSGIRELGAQPGVKLFLSDCGPPEWKYQFAGQHESVLVRDGDSIRVGRIRLDVLHTPGHTPESVSLLLTDEGGGARTPMGIFTGDFIFVGSIGRPDLLERAAGMQGTALTGARDLFRSVRRFLELPDYLQVWPAHGAGSACGKGLGGVPSSTVGYERLYNPALQFQEENAFVHYILSEQPEAPPYFGVMKRVNKEGPALLASLPPAADLDPARLPPAAAESLVIDTCPTADFASGHVPGTINIPLRSLVHWAGFFVDYSAPLYLILPLDRKAEALHALRSIGIDRVAGVFDSQSVAKVAMRTESFDSQDSAQLRSAIESGQYRLIDVRARSEWDEGHIPQAEHWFLGDLLRRAEELPQGQTIVTQCRSGGRSAIAASILQRAGYDVINLAGGFLGWQQAGLPVAADSGAVCRVV